MSDDLDALVDSVEERWPSADDVAAIGGDRH